MDKRELEKEILTAGYEDSTGLWEIIWILNRLAPEMPYEAKTSAARSILKRLIQDGKALLYRRNEHTSHEEELPQPESLEVISVDSNWSTPDLVGSEFRYMNTEKGDRVINKMWAEAPS